MSKIGFIGLGIMGGPMAANLVRAGHEVTGYNRSPAKTERLVEQGGAAASSVAEAVRDADVVITVLPDSPDVEAVVLGEDGVLANAPEGALLIDCSTVRPDVPRRIAERAAGRLRVVDAPVSGGEPKAIDGTLSVMVGAAEEDFPAAREVLRAVGSTVVHVGPVGSGQTVKAANQLVVAGNIALLAEALVFLEAHGVVREREFAPGFRLELHHKDLGIVQDAARQRQLVAPLTALVGQLVAAANAQGDGKLDHSALFRQIAQLNGRD